MCIACEGVHACVCKGVCVCIIVTPNTLKTVMVKTKIDITCTPII